MIILQQRHGKRQKIDTQTSGLTTIKRSYIRLSVVLLTTLLSFTTISGIAQTAASYSFVRSSGTYNSISGTGSLVSGGIYTDDSKTNGIPIGFTFNFCGNNYTTTAANSNGVVSLAGNYATCCYDDEGDINGAGFLMVNWADLHGGSDDDGNPRAYYQTTGTAPNRVFTLEYEDWSECCITALHTNFQVKLYEGTNAVQYCYGSTGNSFYSIKGIANSTSDFQTLAGTSSSASNTNFNYSGVVSNGTILTWSPLPACSTPNPISGITSICSGSTTTLSSTTPDGTWSSGSPSIASINAGSGAVTGLSEGNATITYATGAGPTCFTTVAVTVKPVPEVSVTSQTNLYCEGDNDGSITVSATGGGSDFNYSWAPYGGSAATVTALTNGTYTCTVTADNGCSNTASATLTATHPLPTTPDPITGPTAVCTGNTISLSSSSGGVWSSSNTTRATVNTSGVVAGISPAPVTISYTVTNECGSVSAISSVTVSPTPSTINGPTTVCEGALITLTNTPGGGTWSSPDATVSVVEHNGKVTGVTPGTALISYSTGASCVATSIVTVTTIPSVPSGTLSVCPGVTTVLSSSPAEGTWASSSPGKATVDASSGEVAAISSGVTYITYSLSAGCYNTVAFTVNPAPNVITGALAICPGTTTDLNSTTSGGLWTSDNTAIATVNSATGLVSSVGGAGTTTISYVVGAMCPRSAVVTVAAPSANEGTPMICLGQPFSVAVLTNPTPGGTWSSSNASRVPINSETGVLKGKSVGTVTITYHLGPGCMSTTELTVNPAVPVITGPVALCPGATGLYENSALGGTWSSSNTAVATAGSASGIVAGIFEGTTTISYIINDGCYNSTDITVYGSMSDITGTDEICAGSMTTMSSSPAGGTWSSGQEAATVNMTTGLLTGVSAGTAMITYHNGSSGCYVTKQVTINGPLATISGASGICPGENTTLGNTDLGGTWSSSNTDVATINSGLGTLTGISSGTSIITYTTSPACYTTTIQTINAAPSPIGGSPDVCLNATTYLISSPAGGVWSSSNTANASISTTGVVRGLTTGTATIQYLLSTGCMVTQDVTVNNLPDAITGTTSVCVNATTNLISAPSGGTWTSSNTVKSTIDATSGVLTGKSAGYSYITYTLPSGCYVKTTATTKAPPSGIWGNTNINQGGATILYCSPGGGAWSSANPAVASYNPVAGGRTYGAGAGTTTVTYTIPATGCFSATTVNVVSARPGQETTISGGQKSFSIFPNPSQGVLNVETSVNGTFAVFTIDGRQVASYNITSTATTLSLPGDLAAGMYMCRFIGEDGSTEMVRLVYER